MSKKDRSVSTRQKWLDPKHTKGKVVRQCGEHPFCNIEYEWLDDSKNLKERNSPLVAGMMGVVLPESQDPPDKNITYAGMTEENLDDWIAQSLNRSIASMMNQQKKYSLPPSLEEELRARYRGTKPPQSKNTLDDELYFPPEVKRKADNHLLYKSRKKDLNLQQLVVPGSKLSPREDAKGTPIKIREQRKFAKKNQPRRRGGIYLNDDYYYQRLCRERAEESSKVTQPESQKSIRRAVTQQADTSIFSYNMENVLRKSIMEPIPSSLIESQLVRIGREVPRDPGTQNQLIENFNKLQEQYKDKINETANKFLKPASPTPTLHMSKTDSPPLDTKRRGRQPSNPPQPLHLGEKVKELLNDTHIHSQNLDAELLGFNIHCDEIRIEKYENKPHIKWMIKAQENIRERTYQLAVDCYKQSLIVQPQNFIAVFNVGCVMEKQNALAEAKKWFELAMEFGQEKQRVAFGLSLVCFKKSEFKESLRFIDGIIRECGETVPPIFYYIRALNEKRLGLTEQAKSDYKIIQGKIIPENYNILANLMFSLVFAKLRRMEIRFNCLTYMQFRCTLEYVLYESQKPLIEDGKVFEESKDYDALALMLSKLNFFKRFPLTIIYTLQSIQKRLLPVTKYSRVSKNSLMLIELGHTAVVLSGAVALKNHQKNFQRPVLAGLLSQGDIIGAGRLDNFVSEKPNMWCYCESDVEYVSLPLSDFNSFWKAQFTLDLDRKYAFLKNVQLFRDLSEVSLLRLCEMMELKSYPRNTILFNDCSYRARPSTKVGRGFGLHPKGADDWNGIKFKTTGEVMTLKISSSKLYYLMQKHRSRIHTMKFKHLRYPGLFVLVDGTIEIEDDCGFRTTNFIGKGDYFGENLAFESEGFQRYGRMVVQSETAELYFLSLKNISRLILLQREQMKKSTQTRKDIETLGFIYKRYHEVLKVKLNTREQIRKLRDAF